MNYAMRAATVMDIPEIMQMLRAAWKVAYGNGADAALWDDFLEEYFTDENEHKKKMDRIDSDGFVTLVAVDAGGDIIGYAELHKTHHEHDGAYLHSLYLQPDRTGEGIGGGLLRQVLDHVGAEESLSLMVKEGSRAIGFYEKYGLRISSEPKFWEFSPQTKLGMNMVQMSKTIYEAEEIAK